MSESKFGLEEVNELGRIRDNIVPTSEDKKILIGMIGILQGEVSYLAKNPNRSYDDPESDCTDFAHPAWWRGERYSYLMMCERVNEFLDGKGFEGTGHAEIEAIKLRIKKLLEERDSVKLEAQQLKSQLKYLEEQYNIKGVNHVE